MKIITTPTKIELTRSEAEAILSRVHGMFTSMRDVYVDYTGETEDFEDDWNKLWIGRNYSNDEVPSPALPLQVTICG